MTARSGYTLIEVMVALLIFGVLAAGVAQTLVITERARRLSNNWMEATQLATDRIETVRAGAGSDRSADSGIFHRETVVMPLPGHRRLARIDVTVSWTDSEPKQFTLSTLMRQ